jgi:predicted Rossmann fold flavoprotein
MSRTVGELLVHSSVELALDLLPEMGLDVLNARLQEIFKTHANKMIRNALSDLIAPALVSPLLEMTAIDVEKECNSVTREERIRLMQTLKKIPLTVDHLLGLEKAIVTSGGLALEEVDFKTMRSRKYNNLFLIGDILDIERPSGGYSLQICWTTGFVAGSAAAEAAKLR